MPSVARARLCFAQKQFGSNHRLRTSFRLFRLLNLFPRFVFDLSTFFLFFSPSAHLI